ncbi:MAG TPA: hypothetical protein DIS79_06230 [Bacteroidetes bacterium]|nr:hypothetical protein [Bacteroidota bacterium]
MSAQRYIVVILFCITWTACVGQTYTRVVQLLPYVYFDSASADIPLRYVQKRQNEVLVTDTMPVSSDTSVYGAVEVYRNILNIIGRRMQMYPSVPLKLRAFGDGVQSEEDLLLAQRRAESVRTYLTSVWQVEADRIVIEVGHEPSPRGNPHFVIGRAMNRHVEFVSTEKRLLENATVTVQGDTAYSAEYWFVQFPYDRFELTDQHRRTLEHLDKHHPDTCPVILRYVQFDDNPHNRASLSRARLIEWTLLKKKPFRRKKTERSTKAVRKEGSVPSNRAFRSRTCTQTCTLYTQEEELTYRVEEYRYFVSGIRMLVTKCEGRR